MKTATIVPQGLLDFVRDDVYHMALGHLVGAPGFEDYTEFYAEAGKDPEKFVMLDTGLIEGNARPVDELIEKALLINADEMALNDVFLNGDETLRESHDAMDHIFHGTIDIRMMAIPQGRNMHEWIECAKEMASWPVHTIGIPKVLTKLEGMHGRLYALEAIQDFIGDKDIHLLGCWETPLELSVIENYVRQGKIKPVRGVDSAIAYAYARKGLRITDNARPEGAIDFSATSVDLKIMSFNKMIWEDEASGRSRRDDKVVRLY